MTHDGTTLILGAGPAALQLALDLTQNGCKKIGLYNRASVKGNRLKQYLQHTPCLTLSGAGKAKHVHGTVPVACYIDDTADIAGDWQYLILAVPAHHYHALLQQIDWSGLPDVHSLILLSPSIGSGLMVQGLLQDKGLNTIEVVSLSSYYADTKYSDPDQPHHAFTKAFKQKIYLANQGGDTTLTTITNLTAMLAQHNITTVVCTSLLEAERYSITNYVHPPLALATTTLQAIFNPHERWQYLYKTQPEGPICPQVIATMWALTQDYKTLLNTLGVEEINLLRFLNDDNYPVPDTMVSRRWIDTFPQLSPLEQQYALFTRYTALLVDPYSQPDAQGRFYDFSAVKVASVYQDSNGLWHLPRVPLEDVNKLRVIVALAALAEISLPTASHLLQNFEDALDTFTNRVDLNNCHTSLLHGNTEIALQAALIYRQWRNKS